MQVGGPLQPGHTWKVSDGPESRPPWQCGDYTMAIEKPQESVAKGDLAMPTWAYLCMGFLLRKPVLRPALLRNSSIGRFEVYFTCDLYISGRRLWLRHWDSVRNSSSSTQWGDVEQGCRLPIFELGWEQHRLTRLWDDPVKPGTEKTLHCAWKAACAPRQGSHCVISCCMGSCC